MAKSLLRMNNPSPEFIRLAVMMFLRLFRSSKNSDLPQRMSTMGSERDLAAMIKNVCYADKAAVRCSRNKGSLDWQTEIGSHSSESTATQTPQPVSEY